MRGYRRLAKSSRLSMVGDLKDLVSAATLSECDGKFCKYIFGPSVMNPEEVVRQYLVALLAGVPLNQEILYVIGRENAKITYPLPKTWRKVFLKAGFKLELYSCITLWWTLIFLAWVRGILEILMITAESTLLKQAETRNCLARYVYFSDLSKSNLPSRGSSPDGCNLISWYYKKFFEVGRFEQLRHSVKSVPAFVLNDLPVLYQSKPLIRLCGVREIGAFLKWGVFALFFSTIDLLRGRWWNPLFLREAALAAQARCLPSGCLATAYMFHNSGWIYRPLWTYDAERRGSDIILYFYSTNIQPLGMTNINQSVHYGYKFMSWPQYYVWDKFQADFISQETSREAVIEIVGPILFQGVERTVCRTPDFSLAVFDVNPTRSSFYQRLGLDSEFYIPDVVNAFLGDIYEGVCKLGGHMYLKQKRSVGKAVHPKYRSFITGLVKHSNVHLVDPEVSPLSVIRATDLTISLPYTSTALLAEQEGKVSVFYDPTEKLVDDVGSSHGIRLLSGRACLESWLAERADVFYSSKRLQPNRRGL